MKQLLVVRHAKSDWSDDSLRDFDRPLNERGRHDAPKMAAYVRDQGFTPQLIVTSPARRAYTTAVAFADAFGIPENDLSKIADLYEANTLEFLHQTQQLPDDYDRVALFSHNPGLTYFVNEFSKEPIHNVPTCGAALLSSEAMSWADFDPASARLKQLWLPKEVLASYR